MKSVIGLKHGRATFFTEINIETFFWNALIMHLSHLYTWWSSSRSQTQFGIQLDTRGKSLDSTNMAWLHGTACRKGSD